MAKLTDTQTILLSHAANSASGSFHPLPASLRAGGGLAKALAALLRQGLAEEREAAEPGLTYREDGDLRLGLFVTPAGLSAIGVGEGDVDGAGTEAAASSPAAVVVTEPRPTKACLVLELLKREQGATLPELIAATGWLPHTTRAALTGLRKKGHAIEKTKRDDATCYSIKVAA